MTARLHFVLINLENGYLSGFHAMRQESNASCQGPGMDHIEFCLPMGQMLLLRKCTFQKMARSRSISLECVIAHQDSQPVIIGEGRTRKDQANRQGGSRSY